MIFFAANPKRKAEIAELILNSKEALRVEIEQGDIRSIKANARYWAGVVTATQAHLDRTNQQKYSKEAIHHFFKIERYGKKVDQINGKIYEREARSSKMTPKQFAKFTEWAEAYAILELGVDPGEIDHHAGVAL